MQGIDWDQLRFLLAFERGGNFAAAARLLAVDDTTVSRRLSALAQQLGAPLFRRGPGGTLRLTEIGARAAAHAELMEAEIHALGAASGYGQDGISGNVRLTAVPILANRLLAPRLGALLAPHPGLTLELAAEPRNQQLTRREADLALRLARPASGGYGLWTRRIGMLAYGAYTARGLGEGLPWIGYVNEMAHLPQMRWLKSRSWQGRFCGLQVTDAETAHEAAAAGLGIALLPSLIADTDQRLEALALREGPPPREVWIVGHQSERALPRIRLVTDWLAGLFN
ncbi:MAG: LysR family transcriptional regulator [Albidovulum sp.]